MRKSDYQRVLNTLKTKTRKGAINHVAKVWQHLVRIANSDDGGFCECVSCSTRNHYKNMNGGHYIGRKCTRLVLPIDEYAEANCNVQCVHCNEHLSSNAAEYRKYMVKQYGQAFVQRLESLKEEVMSFSNEELARMYGQLTEEIRAHERRHREYGG